MEEPLPAERPEDTAASPEDTAAELALVAQHTTGQNPSFVQEREDPDGSVFWWFEFASTPDESDLYSLLLELAARTDRPVVRLHAVYPSNAESASVITLSWNRSPTDMAMAFAGWKLTLTPNSVERVIGVVEGNMQMVPPDGVTVIEDVTTSTIQAAADGEGLPQSQD